MQQATWIGKRIEDQWAMNGDSISFSDALALPGTFPSSRSRPRVMVVDDYPMNVELLAANLERLGYDVVSAYGGDEAISAIAAEPPDIVLLDILMPGRSGLDVLRALRAEPATTDMPVILVSGLGDTGHIVEGLALGANDYVTKPIDMPILQARLATQSALKRARDDLKRAALLLAGELDRKARDLEIAGQVQRSILPTTAPTLSRMTAAWHYRPATEVGGDLFDIIPLPGGRTLLFLADAMGHGVQAALVAATVKATLAAHIHEAEDLPTLMIGLDHSLESLFDDRFVTAAACVIDPAAQTIRYVIAGHPPILLACDDEVSALNTGGLPLGTALGWGYEEGRASLNEGSRLLLFSDGLTEAEGRDGSQLGLNALAGRFLDSSHEPPEAIVRAIRDSLDDHRDSIPLDDDLTILVASIDGE